MYFFSKLFNFVLLASAKYNIDESHGITHSMNVLHFANEIYEAELPKNPRLYENQKIIYTAAVLHDMCDKKYMDERDGISDIAKYIGTDFYSYEVDAISSNIIMAYQNAHDLFETRIFKHNDDKLFVHDYAKQKSLELESIALQRITAWRKILCSARSTFIK